LSSSSALGVVQDAELRSAPGATRAFVLSHVTDGRGRFAVREPIGRPRWAPLPPAVRVGLHASTSSRQLVLLDAESGGEDHVAHRRAEVAHLEGIVCAGAALAALAGRLEDFCARRASAGYVAVTPTSAGALPVRPRLRATAAGRARALPPADTRREAR